MCCFGMFSGAVRKASPIPGSLWGRDGRVNIFGHFFWHLWWIWFLPKRFPRHEPSPNSWATFWNSPKMLRILKLRLPGRRLCEQVAQLRADLTDLSKRSSPTPEPRPERLANEQRPTSVQTIAQTLSPPQTRQAEFTPFSKEQIYSFMPGGGIQFYSPNYYAPEMPQAPPACNRPRGKFPSSVIFLHHIFSHAQTNLRGKDPPARVPQNIQEGHISIKPRQKIQELPREGSNNFPKPCTSSPRPTFSLGTRKKVPWRPRANIIFRGSTLPRTTKGGPEQGMKLQ